MLPSSGSISMSQVNVELGSPSTAAINLGRANVRTLAAAGASGPISMSQLRGKSAYTAVTATASNDDSYYDSRGGASTAYVSPSVVAANGNGSYTYTWSVTSNPYGLAFGALNGSSVTAYGAYNANTFVNWSITFQCIVSDGVTSTTKTGITGTIVIENGM